MSPGNFAFFLPQLAKHHVEYILIGGGAAIAHGAARATYDVDIIYRRTPDNLGRIVRALDGIELYYRGAPPGLPFRWDTETLLRGLNFTFTSNKGDIDLIGEAAGNGTWDALQPYVELADLYSTPVCLLKLQKLIELKRAAGRPKDFEAIAELEILLAEQNWSE